MTRAVGTLCDAYMNQQAFLYITLLVKIFIIVFYTVTDSGLKLFKSVHFPKCLSIEHV